MNKLGFGLMRLPSTDPNEPAKIDVEQVCRMVDRFMEQGFTYFDTAWMYNNFASEKAAKKFLVERYPRESFTLATKLHSGFFSTLEERDKVFNTQLENCGVTYFDYYLLHGIERGSIDKYENLDCFNWLFDKKAKGLVKHCGFSFHADPELLDEILTRHPEIEFVQIQLNYLDFENPSIQSRKCYEVCEKHGKPVIVMEPVKGGTLANMPDYAEAPLKAAHPDWSIPSWAIRFAASLPNVMMVLSGMSNLEQVEDNTETVKNMEPLTEAELAAVKKTVDALNSNDDLIPCTGCAYCQPGCPMNIAIPKYFSLYNADMISHEGKGWSPQKSYYASESEVFGKASECIACGQCEGMCPQQLPIIEYLKRVTDQFECE